MAYASKLFTDHLVPVPQSRAAVCTVTTGKKWLLHYIRLVNFGSATEYASVYLVKNGESSATGPNLLFPKVTIGVNDAVLETFEKTGIPLVAGDSLWAMATLENQLAWVGSTAKTLGQVVRPVVANGYAYEATTAGTSDGTEPTWPTTPGNTITDGTVVWTCRSSVISILAFGAEESA